MVRFWVMPLFILSELGLAVMAPGGACGVGVTAGSVGTGEAVGGGVGLGEAVISGVGEGVAGAGVGVAGAGVTGGSVGTGVGDGVGVGDAEMVPLSPAGVV